MFKVMEGVRGVSHILGDGRGVSVMFKVMGGGVSHVQGDGRGVSHIQCDRKGDEGR